ncbi:RecX family transcriptional regulator [Kitasatospora sp. NPDC057904]|uniref:RecX family transcriptional regulator n=1 Tax=unclassified Kitasatospora TaxID=2633591 RepID=UPI0036D82426
MQHDEVGVAGPASPDDDHGPPDWFAAVAEEPGPEPSATGPVRPQRRREPRSAARGASGAEPEFDRAPVRAVRGAAPGPGPAEGLSDGLGLVSASELPTGRRRRRSALAEDADGYGEHADRAEPADYREAAGHGGAAASAPRGRTSARSGGRAGGRSAGRRRTEPDAEPDGEQARPREPKRARAEEHADPESRARDICLRLLTGTAKSRKQLADALRKREIPEDVADQVLTRLEEVGLIDDAAFAAAWVESRHAVRGLSRRALAQELRTKGVAADLVEQAVAQLDYDDETEAARALVDRKLRSTRGLEPQARMRRLVGVLARRGYSEGLAFRVVRAAIEEEDAEADD